MGREREMEMWKRWECGRKGMWRYGKERIMGIWIGLWEERANRNMGTKEKWIGRESGKERKCGGGEREVYRKGIWVYGRKGMEDESVYWKERNMG